MVHSAEQAIDDVFNPPGAYPINAGAGQSVASLASTGVELSHGALVSTSVVRAGGTLRLGLIGINPTTLALLGPRPAVLPGPSRGTVSGLVWRDFSPSHPTSVGRVFPDEDGLPNLHLALLRSDGSTAATTTTLANGQFRFGGVGSGDYRVKIDASNFHSGFTGTFWLGTQSLTPTANLSQTAQALLSAPLVDIAMIIAYLWIGAGFTMVVVAAGLAALDREALEAARVDGATQWQTFRRVTMPMLAPVLTVVFVTMVINVLKIFDIILNMPPGSSQGDASTLALDVYNYGFSGGIHTGLASALAVILFILVVPAMLFNLKRIRGNR